SKFYYTLFNTDDFIYEFDIRSKKTKRITEGFSFTLSPDETQIAVVRRVGKETREIFILDLENGNERQLTNMGGYIGGIDWSPK
ncbi:MAG: hypothetical protein D6707_11990, partial [Bacteroidetes bacterium]